jgi:acyl phosphate:glycerol-3-phosphate acyltransferase
MPPLGIACVAAAYLIGSVSFGLVLARRRGVDLRQVGSGNIGATNVGRALGPGAGWTVLLLDGLKGAVPVAVARFAFALPDAWVAATALAAVLGHLFPVWHRLRGGKGVATGVGALLAAVPLAGALAAATYFALRKLTRRSSVGSLAAALLGAAVTAALHRNAPLTWMACAVALLIVVKHTDNIRRLLKGEEPPV